MDEKSEGLKSLGAYGIVGETFRILRCRPKLLGAITFTLVVPLCVASLAHALILVPLLLQILNNELIIRTGQDIDEEWATRALFRQLTEILLMEAGYSLFAFALWLLSTAAVVYTVALFYTGKQEPSFARVMKVAPTVWRRMVITSLWFCLLVFGTLMAYGFALLLLVLGSSLWNNLLAEPIRFVKILIWGLYLCVSVYVRMVWQLASVVSVLEEKNYGWKAWKKSHRLMEGKRWTACILSVLYFIIEGPYAYAVLCQNWDMAEIAESCVNGAALVAASCVITLMSVLVQSVLYFVCKSHHDESVEEWFLLDCDYLPLSRTDLEPEAKH